MADKLKLLIYGSSWDEKRHLLFYRYLTEFFEVIVITPFSCNEEILELIKPVKVITTKFWIKKKIGLAFSLKFKKYIKKFNPKYILTFETHSISSYQAIRLANKFNFKSAVFSWQNVETIPKLFFQRYLQKKVLSKSVYLLAGTFDTKKYLEKKGANPNKIYINPISGYDEKIFNEVGKLKKLWGFEDDEFIILYSGRLVKEKGINLILNAAKKLETVNDKIKFIFVGKGKLKNVIKKFKSENTFYKGYYDFLEMGKVLRSCDIFIYPSISTKYWIEQFGYSVIEAQACGKAVIVSNSGALPKFIDDEINGSIIEEKNESELIEKILWWYDRLKNKKEIDKNLSARFLAQNIALNYKRILLDNEPTLLNNWF